MPNTMFLKAGWKVKNIDYLVNENANISDLYPDDTWIDAAIPGDIHDDLYRAGIIEQPYFADNSKNYRWVTEKDWCYIINFKLPDDFLREQTKIIFEGIDTFSSIWLNGNKLGGTDNMFREFSFDISSLIRTDTDNKLAVIVKSVKKEMEKFPSQKYFSCFNVPRIFVRKAQCHFGWDWAPDIPAVGIWQRVKVISYEIGHISSAAVRTKIDGTISVFIDVDYGEELELDKIKSRGDELLLKIYGDSAYEKRISVRGVKNFLSLKIENPKLWWPNGYGEPHLYSYSISLMRDGLEIDRTSGKFGIREVDLLQEPNGQEGYGFQFVINKTPVYCKGANWVPVECFTGTVGDEKYINMIKFAKDGNLNMIRVWGGGIYEKDVFYELCDQYGIMVWQDFMFACADIPEDHSWFVEKLYPEVEYQVKRLRNHASVVYWCGCNEKTGSFSLMVDYGEKTINYILRGICGHLDPSRPYSPQSPTGYSSIGNEPETGDTHCSCLEVSIREGIWKFREKINELNAVFTSECAILGPSRYQSISNFIPQEKIWPLNDLWEFRFLNNPYSSLKQTFLGMQENVAEGLFGKFDSVKEFLKKAMAAHAEILRAEAEHARCLKWHSSGFLFWMFSDIWPTGTWAVVDYYQLPKPAYYFVKRSFEQLLLTIQQVKQGLKLFAVNDLLKEVKGRFQYGQKTVGGKIIWSKETDFLTIKANQLVEIKMADDLVEDVPNTYLYARFEGDGFYKETTFFHKLWKDIEWPNPVLTYKLTSQEEDDGCFIKTIEIKTKKYARMVNINLPENRYAHLNDNFFDIEAGGTKRIIITSREDFDCNSLRIDHWLTEWI